MLLKELKDFVFKRAKGLCEYCKSPANISSQAFVMEHIIPKSKGGKTVSENLALACQGCNNYKYNKLKGTDKLSGKKVTLFHLRKQKWKDNFVWSDDTIEILGISSTGRATVDNLKLNRPELKNLRKLLSELGKHPPE
jgi:hypothetical protein